MAEKINIDMELRGATQVSRNLSSIRSGLGAIGSSTASMLGGLQLFAATLTAVAGGAIVRSLVNAASVQEDAVNRMNQSLKASGEFTAKASKDMQDFASALQQTTKFGDETTLNMIALAKSFGATNDQAKKVVTAATELSVAAGIGLEEAVRRVGRSFSGSVEDIARFAGGIRGLTKEELAAGKAADILISRLGGSAQAETNTFSGALTQANNAFGDLLESMGEAITKSPHVIGIIKQVGKIFNELTIFVQSNRNILTTLIADVGVTFFNLGKDVLFGFGKLKVAIEVMGIGMQRAFAQIDVWATTLKEKFLALTGQQSGTAAHLKIVDALEQQQQVIMLTNKELIEQSKIYSGIEKTSKKFDLVLPKIFTVGSDKDSKGGAGTSTGSAEKKFVPKNMFDHIAVALSNTSLLNGLLSAEKLAPVVTTMVSGIAQNLQGGKEGARKLIASVSGAIGEAFIPGLGQIVGPLTDALSQGPEAVKEMVRSFVESIPEIVQNILEALPVMVVQFVESLEKMLPRLVESLAQSMPHVAIALAAQGPFIAVRFATAMIAEFPRMIPELAKAFAEGIKQGAKDIGKTSIGGGGIAGGLGFLGGSIAFGGPIGGFVGSTVGSAFKKLGFAEGGMVPEGFPNDSFPARLTSKEFVVNNTLTPKLEKFLSGQGHDRSLLLKIVDLLSRPMTVSVNSSTVNADVLQEMILTLSRSNRRLA